MRRPSLANRSQEARTIWQLMSPSGSLYRVLAAVAHSLQVTENARKSSKIVDLSV
jgi:hypothetical protein